VQNRVRREVNQVASIDQRHNLHAGGKDLLVQLFHFFMNPAEGGLGVRPFSQQRNSRNDVVVIDDRSVFSMDRPRRLSKPYLWSLRHDRDVLNADRSSRLADDHRIFDVLDVFD